MEAKSLVKGLVTVHSVRSANGKLISQSQSGAAPARAVQSFRVMAKLGNIAASGERAMQSMKKK